MNADAIRDQFKATIKAVADLNEVNRLLMFGGDDWHPEGVKSPGIGDPTANRAIYNLGPGARRIAYLMRRRDELADYIGVTLKLIERVRDHDERTAHVLEARYVDCVKWADIEWKGERVPVSTGKYLASLAFEFLSKEVDSWKRG